MSGGKSASGQIDRKTAGQVSGTGTEEYLYLYSLSLRKSEILTFHLLKITLLKTAILEAASETFE